MKIASYQITESSLHITFDTTFYQITYTKIEFLNGHSASKECDQNQIKYSKPKNSINTSISHQNTSVIIILITEINKEPVDYAYIIQNEIENNSNQFFKKLGGFTDTKDTSNENLIIKNQNIFANIKKKDH